MATLHDDIAAFLDDAVTTFTNLHVRAAQYAGQPDVQAAFGDLASVPGALIEQAQQLRARLEEERDLDNDKPSAREQTMALGKMDLRSEGEPKAKPTRG